MNANQLAAFRAIVHWHVELLLGRHSHLDWLQAIDCCYMAFGVQNWGRANWPVMWRIQDTFKRVAESIAVSWGWVPITTDPYAWLANHCQYFTRPQSLSDGQART